MQHSNRFAIWMAFRVLAIEWIAAAVVMPAMIFGFARLLHVPPATIWDDVIALPRNLLFVVLTVLFAGRTWFAYRFEGQAENDRRRRERRAA
jgi:cbb3-type cytochrome oxidase subunit 3